MLPGDLTMSYVRVELEYFGRRADGSTASRRPTVYSAPLNADRRHCRRAVGHGRRRGCGGGALYGGCFAVDERNLARRRRRRICSMNGKRGRRALFRMTAIGREIGGATLQTYALTTVDFSAGRSWLRVVARDLVGE